MSKKRHHSVRCKRIHCTKGFFLLLAALIYIDGYGLVLYSILAAIIHELGHWSVIRLFGGRICSLSVSIIGAEMKLDPTCSLSYGKEAAAAAAGPLVNLIAAAASMSMKNYMFAGVNLCLGALNLLPIYPLDGGRILVCVLAAGGVQWADTAKKAVALVVGGLALGVAFAAWYWFDNISLLIGAAWLVFSAIKE